MDLKQLLDQMKLCADSSGDYEKQHTTADDILVQVIRYMLGNPQPGDHVIIEEIVNTYDSIGHFYYA